jgi:hypothetical protein
MIGYRMVDVTMNKDVEGGQEGEQANGDVPEAIHLPERDPNSVARIATPRLVDREQVKDFELEVIEGPSDTLV